ncbi:MAG: hypothetical protein AB1801_19275 [Chloroflexota bacterium]
MSSTEIPVWRTVLWAGAGLLAGVLVIFLVFYYFSNSSIERSGQGVEQADQRAPTSTLVPTSTASPTPTDSIDARATPIPVAVLSQGISTPTPVAGGQIYTVSPDDGSIGWVVSSEAQGNNFGDSFLYAGIYDGQIYQSAFQFNLSSIPRGAPIQSVTLQIFGLRDDQLSVHNDLSDATGVWAVRMLAPEIDPEWNRRNFQDIFNAAVLQTLSPILGSSNLAVGRPNTFELTKSQVEILQQRILDNENPVVSFRLDGPVVGPDNLFAWDTGNGPESLGNEVALVINAGPPPATVPPYKYVVVTNTPTPGNVATAAAIVLQMTAQATRLGTPTPTPPNLVTATSVPDSLVITPTSTPENAATAEAEVMMATAIALTTGTPTPLPTNAVTATPTATATPTPTYVLITAIPSPDSIFAAATQSAAATAWFRKVGTPTPLPANWVTPIVVTSTPTPVNAATAQALALLATAEAFTTGTPTPLPGNFITATPTPVYNTISLITIPTPATPTPTPQSIPPVLVGKILFRSDREGMNQSASEGGNNYIYVYDPETGQLGRLTDNWPYEAAVARDVWSADLRFRVFTKDFSRYRNVDDPAGVTTGVEREDVPALFNFDNFYDTETQLTSFGKGIAYGGVWSPTTHQIAFVSNDSGDDEIWVVNADGSNLKQLTASNAEFNAREIGKDTFLPELSKYPSWSPDGKQIVFTSNRTGNEQLWIMNADGSDERLLMGWDNWTPYNDSQPVWVKYLDPAPFVIETTAEE